MSEFHSRDLDSRCVFSICQKIYISLKYCLSLFRISDREAAALAEFALGDKKFHAMRDHHEHFTTMMGNRLSL